jgi:hypothetical protein
MAFGIVNYLGIYMFVGSKRLTWGFRVCRTDTGAFYGGASCARWFLTVSLSFTFFPS